MIMIEEADMPIRVWLDSHLFVLYDAEDKTVLSKSSQDDTTEDQEVFCVRWARVSTAR